MRDKILKVPVEYVHAVQSKRPKCQKDTKNSEFWPHFRHFLGLKKKICPDLFSILSDISWDKFRVPTTHTFEKISQLEDF